MHGIVEMNKNHFKKTDLDFSEMQGRRFRLFCLLIILM